MDVNSALTFAMLSGDGVGPEVIDPCMVPLTELVEALDGSGLVFETFYAGEIPNVPTGGA